VTPKTPLRRRAFLFVALASLIVGLTPAAGAQSAPTSRYIVVLEDSVSGVGALASALADQYEGRVGLTFSHALKGFTITLTQDEVAALDNHPLVDYVEEDGVMSISTTQPNATWGLDRIDQRSLPLDTTFNFTNTGSGVDAYIIDTGIRFSHSDFGGRAIHGIRRRGRRQRG
jgi:subtilisin family serine protease